MKYAADLFGMFERAHLSDEYEGNGIGLSIVKRAVERMGGEVDILGCMNNGCTVTLKFPKRIVLISEREVAIEERKRNEIAIGIIGAYEGSYAVIAPARRYAYEQAAREINESGGINGKKLRLVIRDFKSDGAKVSEIVWELAEIEKVDVIMGGQLSSAREEIRKVCNKQGIYIVAGMVEKAEDKLYNTAILTGPEGLVGKYRKIHLCEIDKEWAEPGNLGFPHFNIPIGRVGILIGHDAMFPEPARILALAGCDVVCFPSAMNEAKPYGLAGTNNWHNYPIPMGYSTIHWHLWRVRGGENNVYSAFANYTGDYVQGEACFGRSGIFQPDTFLFPRNEKILGENEEAIATVVIDTSNLPGSAYPTNVVRRKDLVLMRKPTEYDVIIDSEAPVYDFFK